jgi:hypothetical protein
MFMGMLHEARRCVDVGANTVVDITLHSNELLAFICSKFQGIQVVNALMYVTLNDLPTRVFNRNTECAANQYPTPARAITSTRNAVMSFVLMYKGNKDHTQQSVDRVKKDEVTSIIERISPLEQWDTATKQKKRAHMIFLMGLVGNDGREIESAFLEPRMEHEIVLNTSQIQPYDAAEKIFHYWQTEVAPRGLGFIGSVFRADQPFLYADHDKHGLR